MRLPAAGLASYGIAAARWRFTALLALLLLALFVQVLSQHMAGQSSEHLAGCRSDGGELCHGFASLGDDDGLVGSSYLIHQSQTLGLELGRRYDHAS